MPAPVMREAPPRAPAREELLVEGLTFVSEIEEMIWLYMLGYVDDLTTSAIRVCSVEDNDYAFVSYVSREVPVYTQEDIDAYAKVLSEVIWFSHLPNELVHLIAATEDGSPQFWELRTKCIYNRLELLCPSQIHRYDAGERGSIDPRHKLGKVDALCGNGEVIIISEEALEFIKWMISKS